MTESEKLRVFLCHSPADKAAIRELYERLLKHSWIDSWLDEEKLLPGQDKNSEIKKAVQNANIVIVGLSKTSIAEEGNIQREYKYALDATLEKPGGTIFIIPLILEDLKGVDIPKDLKPLHCEDYFPKKRRTMAFDRLLQSLKIRADNLNILHEENAPVTATPKPSENKYSKENKTQMGVVSTAEFPIHEIPFQKNRNFTGRKDVLDSIHEEFSTAQSTVPIHIIRGMGGIGKTQIAVHYSYEFSKEYDLVYWIRSETDASLTADYEALTQALELPVKTKAEQLVYVNIVNNWLTNTDKKWLLVFDNVESKENIEKLLPKKGNGQILITSQSPNWKELGEDSQIRPFTNEEASEFLQRRIGEKGLEHSDKLNALLGGLPLALEQACAYMTAHGTPIEVYIKLFEEQQEELWKQEIPPKNYRSTIMTTWEMAFKQIQETQPAAKQLLNLFAFFGPDDIPISIIKTYSNDLPEALKKAVDNPIELEENLSAIYRYSLIERNGDFISFHRLVQDVIRTQLPKEQATNWVNIAVQIMKKAFPYDEYDMETWAICSQLLPHALATANHAEKYNTGLEKGAEIYQKTGEYLRGKAEYQRAGELVEHAINIRQEILGTNHEKLAVSLDYLGEIRQEQANYSEALRLHNLARSIFESGEDLETNQGARNLGNLGRLLYTLSEFEKAKAYYEQALPLYNVTLKKGRADKASCLHGIGNLFQGQGEYKIAQKYIEEALVIRRTVLGENHPEIAMSLNDLGVLFRYKHDNEMSRRFFEEAFSIRLIIFGENHPDTAISLNNLGGIFFVQSEFENARKNYERAYTIDVLALGENHPSTAIDLSNIGTLLVEQSKYAEARGYLEKALLISEKAYGAKHHDLIVILKNLAIVMLHLKLFHLSRHYYERATKICSEAKGKYRECEDIKQLQKSISLIGKPRDKKKKHK